MWTPLHDSTRVSLLPGRVLTQVLEGLGREWQQKLSAANPNGVGQIGCHQTDDFPLGALKEILGNSNTWISHLVCTGVAKRMFLHYSHSSDPSLAIWRVRLMHYHTALTILRNAWANQG